MHKARLGSDDLREMGEKGDDVVLGLALDLVDAGHVELGIAALVPNGAGGSFRHHAELHHGIGGMGLDLEPDAKTGLGLPDGSHFGAAVAGDHGWAFNRLGGPMASGQSAWNGTAR